MNKIIGVFFLITCFATSAVSNSIMGAGAWFWGIIVVGCLVAISQFYPRLRPVGSGLALLLGIISICAILLGMLAATIGGSFKMDDSFALLMFLFFNIAVLGFILASLYKKSIQISDDSNS